MRAYELMVIISGNLEESVAHSWLKNITNSITSVGGTVHGNPDWWGKRRLAYQIKKQDDGYYAIFNLVAPGGATLHQRCGIRALLRPLLRLPDDEATRRGLISVA